MGGGEQLKMTRFASLGRFIRSFFCRSHEFPKAACQGQSCRSLLQHGGSPLYAQLSPYLPTKGLAIKNDRPSEQL